MLTLPQIGTLVIAALCYLAAGVLALASPRQSDANRQRTQRGSRIAVAAGLLLTIALFLWHSLSQQAAWQPLGDNFAALLGMAALIAGFLLYIQFRHPIASIELFLLPVILALLLLAGFFGQTVPQSYLPTAWSIVHRVTTFFGAVAFAIAAATGALYLRADRALRSKRPGALSPSTSLERLSRLNYTSVTLGFALLTIGCITGFIWMHYLHASANPPVYTGSEWLAASKIRLALAAWVVYAVVLHTPITPRLRGRRNAWLSIGGFALMVLSILAVLLMAAEER